MHDITWIRDNASAFDAGLARRGLEALSASLIALDEARRAAIGALQEAQTRRNAISKEIGQAMAQKDMARADSLKAEVAALKDGTPALEADERAAIKLLNDTLAAVPNLALAEVPEGADEHGNVEYRRHGSKPEEGGRLHGANALREHFELGEALSQMDFETAAKLSGSRFV
ncbi:MAG: serine--tRNA ligase, partial [Bosea sp. (in: a-proteobacteria)]